MARIADLLNAGRTFSFEFFPPKTDMAQLTLGRTIAELEPLALAEPLALTETVPPLLAAIWPNWRAEVLVTVRVTVAGRLVDLPSAAT